MKKKLIGSNINVSVFIIGVVNIVNLFGYFLVIFFGVILLNIKMIIVNISVDSVVFKLLLNDLINNRVVRDVFKILVILLLIKIVDKNIL